MKVHSVDNQYINYKGLKISYNAEYKLRNSDPPFVGALFKLGKEHEGNQYIDILVLKNLAYRIKEKGNPFFCIKEPFHLKKISDNKLKLDANYDGVEDEVYKKGDRFYMDFDFETPEEIDEIIDKFSVLRGLQRISFIAKLIENYFVKTKSEHFVNSNKRDNAVTFLMDKYAEVGI